MINQPVEATEGSIDPDEYRVGPGDKLFISIAGIEDINLNLTVNQEGVLYIPKVGGIQLNKITLTEARSKISSAINKYYRNVDVFISLTDFRKIKVSLLGDVKKPSSYIFPGNARLVDLIMNSTGLNPTSDLRNIKVINRESDTSSYDFLSFLRFGKRSENPGLGEGDIIVIDKIDRTIAIWGSVKYPGIYEYLENETPEKLIELAGGFLFSAKKDTIELVRFSENGKNQVSSYYPANDLKSQNLTLYPKDKIIVRELPDYYIDKFVRIDGFVNYPGYYKINENQTTLSQIVSEAGGFREEASLEEASIYRNVGDDEIDPEFERLKQIPRGELSDDEYDYLKAKSRQRIGKVITDFNALFRNGSMQEEVVLKRGDIINIPEAKNYIIMLGQVVNPGNIIYRPELTIEDYIELAGGFGWHAQKNDIRVIKANSGKWEDADDVDSLEPGDTIWIPEDPPAPRFWDVFTTSLNIVGQVAAIIAATVAIVVASR